MREVVGAWNDAFKAATGCDGVIVLHENETKDHGDPRFNMLVFIDKRSEGSPLGFGPSFFDPTTGENLSAKSYLYGDAIKYVMRSASDYYDLASGRRKPLDFAVSTEPGRGGGLGPISRDEESGVSLETLTRVLPRTAAAGRNLQQRTMGGSPHHLHDALRTLETARATPLAQSLLKATSTAEMKGIAAEFQAKLQEEIKTSFGSRSQGCAMMPELHLASAIKMIDAYSGKSKEELLAELESRMVFTTMLHEVGHNLGLRHNFHGSFDESNYPSEYHALRGATEGEPVDGEWAFKYRTSSVMDYLDDFEALYKKAGPYDVAALKFGYGELLESVTLLDDNGAFITKDVTVAEHESVVQARLAANPDMDRGMAERLADIALNVRPYKFCTDEHVWDDPTCNRFDRGTTMAEITQSRIEDYDSLYFLYGFRRDRRMFTGNSASIISRFIMPTRQLLDEYVYRIINDDFAAEGPTSQDDLIEAINAGIGFYNKILNTPEPGVYHLDEATGQLVSGRSEEEGAKNMVVDLTTGKYLEARSEIIGASEKALNRGIELDKLGVLWAMSMRGYPAEKYERASLSLSYIDLLRDFTVDKFSAIMRDDLEMDIVAARSEGSVDFVPVLGDEVEFDAANPSMLKAKIKPSSSLALQQYAALFAAIDFNSTSDRTFGDYFDYRLKGLDDGVLGGAETVEFQSISGVRTYVVANTADDKSVTYKIALKAAENATRREALKASLGELSDPEPLKVSAIDIFAKAWALGDGAPMPDNIRDILAGNFDANLAIMRLILGGYIEDAADEEIKAKLEEIAVALEAALAAYEAVAASRVSITDEIETIEREVIRAESDLINLKSIYTLFN